MLQFILEAVVLSVVGGAAIITAHGITQVATVVFPVAYTFSLNNAVLAMGSALLVGVGSSFFLPCRTQWISCMHCGW